MKAIKFMMVLAVMLSAVTFSAQAQNKKKALEEVTFNVSLHCNDCVKKAENVVPGRALESCEWFHLTEKFLVWKKSELPFSPVWSLEYVRDMLPLNL